MHFYILFTKKVVFFFYYHNLNKCKLKGVFTQITTAQVLRSL